MNTNLADPRRAAAARLLEALRTRKACPPVRDLIDSDDVEAAYAVQQHVVGARIADGARVVGRKIGLTSLAVQAQLGVDQPDFGVLLDDMDASAVTDISTGRLLQPKVEAEIAFILDCDLDDGILDIEQVSAAVEAVAPALEIVDSRIAGWDITFADTVADNGSSGLFVLGNTRVPLREVTPVEAVMQLTVDGEIASTGTGAACLGDPLLALTWLAETARRLGSPLRTGEVVLSGALGPMVPVRPGIVVEAHISGLGSVEARFSA